MNIEIKKLTPELADGYVRFFDKTPHNDKWNTKCYCVCWCSNEPEGIDCSTEEKRRAVALQFVKDGNLQGYLAYLGDEVIGWCNANNKAECTTSRFWRRLMPSVPTDDIAHKKVKSVFCFTIAPEMQRKGVATQLLERVCKDAVAEEFDYVEVYPNRVVTAESENHGGYTGMYEKLEFTVYAELENNYVMRKELTI
mgnify:FL=1